MKKVFTSISMALCLMASSFTTSAQTAQLSEAQKKEIQKEVLPVVFEQIKQQAGLDILGWAQPQLTSDFIGSLPVLNAQSGLRATEPTAFNVKPDSIMVNVAAIPDIPPVMVGMMGDIKVSFDNHKKIIVPLIGEMVFGRGVEIEMPGVINVTSSKLGELAVINITTTGGEGDLIPFTMDMTISIMNSEVTPMLGISFTQNTTTHAFEAAVDLQAGMRAIMELIKGFSGETTETEEPALDYVVSINLPGMLATGELPVSLYGILESAPDNRIPMGDAAVALDLTGKMPVKYIGLTSYENAVAKGWRKLWFNMEQKTAQDLVLTIDNYVYTTEAKTDSAFGGKTIITMSDYSKSMTLTNAQSALRSVIDRVVSELATEGKASMYEMQISTIVGDINADGILDNKDAMPVMDIHVTPSVSGTNMLAAINIKSYDYDEETGIPTVTEMDVNAALSMTSEVIKVDVVPAGAAAPLASAYLKSNAFGVVTSNDDITINTVKVTPVDGGIYIDNSGKATYRIVNMSGATIANGTVSGDNAYISTSSLAKGIYVIVVTENGVSQSVKFAR
ncbi:T9SS type A sorting domain-containing protein [Parabacteroides hominis]|jgi:hypothetical protein|uniref:T9SS type A sorting domain-containing protein n=1 Tax=Parabacteroides hominis TaxID=2763057 RepID=A0ABR7DM92_9BACT|nr:T9SS type A sorting domain-containing protein [Parabacteroides hominis]MBC5631778.1 T9SS type A sorting domain-containing protein [Parabacteroides hominis]MBD9165810.1 T9SS C-terminal target domain-containing protein [Parabacteroides johnsonii]